MIIRALAFALALAAGGTGAATAIDGFDFADAEAEARYQRLLATFRCPKCLNESLASSGAPIAADLRRTVRRLIAAGASDAAIRDHLKARYGDFVLYDPPLTAGTLLLWLAPAALGVVVAVALARMARGRTPAPTAADRERAEQLRRT